MARKKLDEMNNGELYKHYRTQSYIAKGGKWASIIAPFGIIFGVKIGEYVEILGDQTYKLTIGAILCIFVAVIAIYKEFKQDKKKQPLLGIVGWGVAFAIIYLLEVMTKDLLLIVGAEFAGQCVAKAFELYGTHAENEASEYKELAREQGTLIKKEKKEKKVEEEVAKNDFSGLI